MGDNLFVFEKLNIAVFIKTIWAEAWQNKQNDLCT